MMKPRRFPLNKAHDICRLHQIEPNFTVTAILSEKAPGKLQVNKHC